ncbi:hypothetical protein ACFZDG_13155 [Kitasatospora xanthocidica]|uniref:hypothetical protein n=1 Tax=Kitasatospora xanthocidica TaxID=83382 RepID=UPI0036DFF46B
MTQAIPCRPRRGPRAAVRAFLVERGVPDPDGRIGTLLACIDGLVFDRLVGGGEPGSDEIHGLVAAALRGAAGSQERGSV